MNTYGLNQEISKKQNWHFPVLILVMLVISSVVTTQYIAYSYNYHVELGSSFFGIYSPWKWIEWSLNIPDTFQVFDTATSLGTAIFVFPVGTYILLLLRKKPKGNKNLHGSATWAKLDEIKKTSLLNGKGVYLGGIATENKKTLAYLRHDGAEHILVYAPTRSGKGISIVVPTLLSWEESALILDIKGENWALSAGYRKSIGHNVFRFDPTDYSGNSARFNPLEEIRLHTPRAIPDTQNIASMIVDPEGEGLKDYWNKAAFSFLAGAILHCLIMTRHTHKRHANLLDLSTMLADPKRDIALLFEEMLDTPHSQLLKKFFGESSVRFNDAIETFIKSSAREMLQKAPAELSGVINSTLSNLSLYRDPVIAQNISQCDFTINDLMNSTNPISVYLVLSPNDIDRIRPLIRLIINIIMRRLVEKMEFEQGRAKKNYKHRLLLLLDEFTSLGKLEIFEKALAYMASYGVKAVIIIQDIPQLHKEYSKNESIMSNCHIKVAYATNNIETAKQLSEMTGKTTVVEQKTSLSGSRIGSLKNANVSISETARSLLTPDEISRLPGLEKEGDQVFGAGDVLIFVAGCLPIYGKQMPFFFDSTFKVRSAINPPIKSDSINSMEQKNEKIQLNGEQSDIKSSSASFAQHLDK